MSWGLVAHKPVVHNHTLGVHLLQALGLRAARALGPMIVHLPAMIPPLPRPALSRQRGGARVRYFGYAWCSGGAGTTYDGQTRHLPKALHGGIEGAAHFPTGCA
jgi:hypothetical protein